MVITTVDLRIGGDHFRIELDTKTGLNTYFLNGDSVTVRAYLTQMQHYREMETQRIFGRPAAGAASRPLGQ
jgi:hypothetical protein